MIYRTSLRLLAVAIAWVALEAQGVTQEGMMVKFGKFPTGALPAGFSTGLTGKGKPVVWEVVDDPTAPSGRALRESSADQTGYRFPLAIYEQEIAANVLVSVRFKPVAGKVDRAAGIAARLIDANNYYVVRANALEDNVRFYRVVNGNRQQIAGVSHKIPSGVWQQLGLWAEGEKFTVSLDGKELFSTTDRTFTGAGKVALWTKADSMTHFDDLEIRPLH